MPKVVDHEQRRRQISEAVFSVIGSRGIGAVSLRDVAAEAGVSMGMVQHYFKTKDEMLLFAMNHMRERVLARLSAQLATLENPSARDYNRTVAQVLLPLDQPSREEALVNLAFFSLALSDDELAALIRSGYQRLQEVGRDRMQADALRGEVREGIDVEKESAAFFYLIQGLIGPVVIGAMTPEDAMTVVDHQLDRIYR